MSKITIIIYISILSLINSLIIDINSDFDLNIEYRLEKQETGWLKRGKITFRVKDPSNYKSTASLIDFNFTPQMKKEIQKECKLKGNYILQFTNPKNISQRYYTAINPCNIVSSSFHDKLSLNAMTPITQGKIKSINYLADEDFEEDFDDLEDDEEVVKKPKGKKGLSKIELSQIKKFEGPLFAEEDDGVDEAIKKKKEEREKKAPKSFLGRYWHIIAIIMLMMMLQGGGQDQPQGGQAQGQGQGQGQAQGENK